MTTVTIGNREFRIGATYAPGEAPWWKPQYWCRLEGVTHDEFDGGERITYSLRDGFDGKVKYTGPIHLSDWARMVGDEITSPQQILDAAKAYRIHCIATQPGDLEPTP